VKEDDRGASFEQFLEGVNRLQADRAFREVLLEIDAEGEDAASLLGADPAAYLKHRGVEIPEDFRISVEQTSRRTGTGTGTTTRCWCVRICWLWWCVSFCFCRIVRA
jgi:hypothetical protein